MTVAAKQRTRRKRRSSSLSEEIKLHRAYSGVKVILEEITTIEEIEANEIPVNIEKLKYATRLIKEQRNPSDYFENTTEYQIFIYNSLEWNKYFEDFVNQKSAMIDKELYLNLLNAILKIRKEQYPN